MTRKNIQIALVVLLVFGPRKLPELARGVGEAMKELKETLQSRDSEERAGADEQRLSYCSCSAIGMRPRRKDEEAGETLPPPLRPLAA